MPLYTADALVLRTYKLGEADRIVVFLTRDRGKKRGVAKGARRPRSRFVGALEPLTEVRVAYFEKERRELVGLNYAETVRSPLGLVGGPRPGGPENPTLRDGPPAPTASGSDAPGSDALGYVSYFAELLDEWAQDADADERLYRLGASMLNALSGGAPVEPLARYFEYWLLRLQGVYPEAQGDAFGAGDGISRRIPQREPGSRERAAGRAQDAQRAGAGAPRPDRHAPGEDLKSDRVLRDLRRHN